MMAITMAALLAFTGCTKETTIAWYKYFGLEDMQYVTAEKAEAAEFFSELGDVMDEYNNTSFSDSEFISSVNSVVKKYNNGVLKGTFYLKKSTKSEDGPWTTLKSWTMKLNSKYTKAEGEELSRRGAVLE